MTKLNSLVFILILCSLILLCVLIVTLHKIRKTERLIINTLWPIFPESSLLIIDYRTKIFKKLDDHLSQSSLKGLTIILIAPPWLYKLKKRAWNMESIYLIDSSNFFPTNEGGFSKLISRINNETRDSLKSNSIFL